MDHAKHLFIPGPMTINQENVKSLAMEDVTEMETDFGTRKNVKTLVVCISNDIFKYTGYIRLIVKIFFS